jgi:hypothetical protein
MRQLFALLTVACFWPIGDGVGTEAFPSSLRPQGAVVAPVPVLVELFTAEGCSSCPPADTLLEKLIESQPAAGVQIVGLGEHVDYWDRLGWKDRFSSAALTARQQKYANRSKSADIYTPQMVVDGQDAFVGSDLAAARRAIERAVAGPHGRVRIAVDEAAANVAHVAVTVASLPASAAGDRADLLVAITEDRLRTEVKRGENQGRTLAHAAVVRDLRTVAEGVSSSSAAEATIKLASDWARPNLKVVAFVQERGSRRVLATAVAAIAGGPSARR